ncbi:hypothetical protein A3709_05170 [Halioglobus sp. HI00S01]|uniref:hypothetical protein n=1 Tax=Halioglobus sp. HI00S01 TaxID=1822214 RepID=UPI0007C36FF4|nr:hypothetical protein [Halioglobus sp. HI00S01]KZX57147.1 hypothetical protein A3709_05170 [Halioglobus sp. HI00S01]
MTNLTEQIVSAGLPALLVHCAMHSWWDTLKKGKPIPGNTLGKARANKRTLEQWQQDHPDSSLPAWGDFIGIASTKLGPKKPITLVPVADAPLQLNIAEGYTTEKTDLYNSHYVTPEVTPLLRGLQRKDDEVVMWEAPRGKGKVIGLTLGHNDDEWDDPVFQGLLKSAIDYLLEPQ